MLENPVFYTTLAVAVVGIALVLYICYANNELLKKDRLNKYRPQKHAFGDLVIYDRIISDGVVLNKNGSLTACFTYIPADLSGTLNSTKDSIAQALQLAIKDLKDWIINVDTKSAPTQSYPDARYSSFPDAMSLAIDEERRLFFESKGTMYDGYYVISFTWLPPELSQQKLVSMLYDSKKTHSNKEDLTASIIAEFETRLQSLVRDIDSVMPLHRLKRHECRNEQDEVFYRDDLVEFLYYCASGEQQSFIVTDEDVTHLDNLLGIDFEPGFTPQIGNKFAVIVALDQCLMQSTHAGILNELAILDCEYRWSSRFILIPKELSVKLIERRQKKWQQKIRGFFQQLVNAPIDPNKVNQDALRMVQDANAAKAEIDSDLTSNGFYTSNIILMGENLDDLKDQADLLRSKLTKFGFKARIETINATEAYLGSLPGHGYENIRRFPINTFSFSNLIPISQIWTGSASVTCPMYPQNSPALLQAVTYGNRPFHLNLHVGDLGHFVMFGATRAGKSTFLALIALQARRYEGMKVFWFDKGYSAYPTTEAVGGVHYDLLPESENIQLNPFEYMETVADRAFLAEWIGDIVEMNGVEISAAKRTAISTAINDMYLDPPSSCSLSTFYSMCQDEDIKAAVRDYTVDGLQGRFFDGQKDSIDMSDFVTFEIGEVMKMAPRYRVPILLYLFRRILRSLDGRPALVLIDEAWIALSDPTFVKQIREFFKSFAKLNCSLGLITQSMEDAKDSGILPVISESTATKIFLANPDATNENFVPLYKQFGLNSTQILTISTMRKKRDYYFYQNNHDHVDSCMFDLALTPLALSIVGATDPASIKRIRQLVQTHGRLKWIKYWLNEKGLDFTDYLGADVIVQNNTFTVGDFARDYGYVLN